MPSQSVMKDRVMNLDHNQLRAFVTVVETKSFSKAALRLHRVQSAVSQQVQKLEAQLQTRLFKRNKQGLELTPSGERLLSYARRMLEVNDQAIAEFTGQQGSRKIRIGTSEAYASSYLTDLLTVCFSESSGFTVEVIAGYSDDIWKLYELGKLDIVLTQGCPRHINAELVYTEHLAWVCAEQSAALGPETVALALFTQGCADRAVALDALNRDHKTFSVSVESTTYLPILSAIASGCYVSAVLPSSITCRYRVLSANEGFPELPCIALSLACRDAASSSFSHYFASATRHYFKRLAQNHSPRESSPDPP
jgi:DNA-binding transcriptional LysR family regulator